MFFSARKLRAKLQYFSDICKENRRFSIRTAAFFVSLCLGLGSVFSRPSVGGTQIKERHPSDVSPYYIHMCVRRITKQYPRRKWLVTTRKTRFAESNRTPSSPHKLKFAGTPKRKERSNNRSFLYYIPMHILPRSS